MFSLNSFFSRKMTKLFDLCWLNVLCLVTCIPIITIGPAFTALYTVLLAMSKDQEAPVTKMFFRAFKENFKKRVGCRPDLYSHYGAAHFRYSNLAGFADGDKASVCDSNCYFNCPAAMLGCWLFPLLAKFDNTVKNMFKNAAIFAFKYFPISLAMGIVVVGYVVIVLEWFFNLMIPFLFIGINILAYPWTFYVRSRFDKYLEERGSADTIRENTSGNQTN